MTSSVLLVTQLPWNSTLKLIITVSVAMESHLLITLVFLGSEIIALVS
jgi:hypothetical protein